MHQKCSAVEFKTLNIRKLIIPVHEEHKVHNSNES